MRLIFILFFLNTLEGIEVHNNYGRIVILDVKTGLIHKQSPKILRSAQEDMEMYKRHWSEDTIKLTIEPIQESYEELEYEFPHTDKHYEVNPFDSKFKMGTSSEIIIPKLPDDPRDGPLLVVFNHLNEEK